MALDEKNEEGSNSTPFSIPESDQSVVIQNHLDSLSRIAQNTTYWNHEEEFDEMEEEMMMPNPEYEPYIQIEPIPGKDDEIPFQQGEVRQLADDYY